MIMLKNLLKKRLRFLSALLITLLFIPSVWAETEYEWDFFLSPELTADHSGYLVLANKESLLSSDYVPDDLVKLTVNRTVSDASLRLAAAQALQEMFAAASAEGMTLYVKSAYRSYKTQNTMYYNRLQKMGRDDGLVQMPGASDHQTGLGVDILNYEWTKKDGMNEKFALTQEAQWMEEHCFEFGFIIRYLKDKEEITGIKYEPWHLRYVGKEAAAYIREHHLSLEEFSTLREEAIARFEADNSVSLDEYLLLRSQPKNAIVVNTSPEGEEDYSSFY